jgi:hypothetical protein
MSAFLKMWATRGATCSSTWNSRTKVNALGDKLLGVLDGDVGIVAVVEHEQFHAGGGRGGGDTLGHGDGEGHLRALDGETEAQAARARDQPVKAILRLGHIAAMHQRLEDAVDAGLGDLGLLEDVFKRTGA